MRPVLAQLPLKVCELALQRVLLGLGDAGVHPGLAFEALEGMRESSRLSLRESVLALVLDHLASPSLKVIGRACVCYSAPRHLNARRYPSDSASAADQA